MCRTAYFQMAVANRAQYSLAGDELHDPGSIRDPFMTCEVERALQHKYPTAGKITGELLCSSEEQWNQLGDNSTVAGEACALVWSHVSCSVNMATCCCCSAMKRACAACAWFNSSHLLRPWWAKHSVTKQLRMQVQVLKVFNVPAKQYKDIIQKRGQWTGNGKAMCRQRKQGQARSKT